MPKIKGQYRTYEEIFFRKIKGNLDMPSYSLVWTIVLLSSWMVSSKIDYWMLSAFSMPCNWNASHHLLVNKLFLHIFKNKWTSLVYRCCQSCTFTSHTCTISEFLLYMYNEKSVNHLFPHCEIVYDLSSPSAFFKIHRTVHHPLRNLYWHVSESTLIKL